MILMNLNENILNNLAVASAPVSGEKLAAELCVSRNAIWKSINSLRRAGYKITASPRLGYMLSPDNPKPCAAMINSRLKNCRLILLDEADSTSTVIKFMAEQGAPEGTAVLAHRQTAGRGRLGRSFISPEGGLYFSLLLRPDFAPELALKATSAAAVAVCLALEKNCCEKCRIKWVNDIYINDKKVCGILTEGAFDAETGGIKYAVLGIGINITEPQYGFDSTIADRAAAVFGKSVVNAKKKADIVADTLNIFMDLYAELDNMSFMDEYRSRSWLNGKKVSYEKNGKLLEGSVVEIDETGSLLIENGGDITSLSAGEVSVKIK